MYINFTVKETNTTTDRQIWGKNCTNDETQIIIKHQNKQGSSPSTGESCGQIC
jgi:hypothetical protein